LSYAYLKEPWNDGASPVLARASFAWVVVLSAIRNKTSMRTSQRELLRQHQRREMEMLSLSKTEPDFLSFVAHPLAT
jgi:hypothetical protein